ncbi:MAG: 4a-hydroxytetrahydrobiopterin dehydratase [Betaproteobacteria bacterium]|nr:4a-hydroxytetrahydrobiopterin dehydratase [Betaproteobacteria bacterium]
MNRNERCYDDAAVRERLARSLPHWRLEGGELVRDYRTEGWKATLMVVNALGHLAEAAWHHPDLEVSWDRVRVKLHNHAARGITDKDFELALKMEALIQWQPGREGGALEGTPQDPAHRYIRYDA